MWYFDVFIRSFSNKRGWIFIVSVCLGGFIEIERMIVEDSYVLSEGERYLC